MADPSRRTYGGKTSAERAAERRARLVDATVHVLSRPGPTTMTAICTEAGLTERYFYESFASLDDALLGALDTVSTEILTAASTIVAATPGSPEERVRAVMTAFVAYAREQPDRVRLAVVHAQAFAPLRSRRTELLGTFADLVADEARELFGDSAWSRDRARAHGVVYIAGLAELVAGWLAGTLTLDDAALVDVACDLFVAIGRRPA
ncbi:MAG: TetR/AcrR family transcriptional regulator [Aeromicrobium erythreum]